MLGRAGLALFLTCGRVAFPAALPAVPDYFIKVWQAEDGLPQNAVTAVLQTRDGYLWLGTYNGLVRFDGVRFKVFDNSNTPELQSSRVTTLFEDDSGTLWIGQETGDLARYTDGHFQAVEVRAAWNRLKLFGVGTDDAGDVWLLNSEGLLARLRDGLVLSPAAGTAAGLVALARDARGTMWIARDGAASVLKNGHVAPLQFEGPSYGYVQGLCPSRDGGLWVASEGGLRKWRDNRWVDDLGPSLWGQSPLTALIETQTGRLVAGTPDQGLYVIVPHDGVLHFSRTNGLPHDWVRCLCEDREGNLWVGTGSGGLAVLRASKVSTVNAPDRWQGRAVLSVSPGRNGTLWVGTEGAGLYRSREGQWTNYAESAGVSNLFVWSVAEDARGRPWAGTWGGGLLVQRGDHFERAPGLENVTAPMPALLHAADGASWVGTGVGLLRYEDGQVTWFDQKAGLALPDVRTIAEGPDGTVWFGMSGGGLGRIKNGVVQQFRKSDGLSSDFVQCLHLDDDVLWIGTFGGGLNRLKQQRFAVVNTSQGLPNNVICHIADDGHGFFWMSSYGGIMRVSKEELNRCADGLTNTVHCLVYGKGDGMPTLECSGGFQPAGCKTADGRLWFPTSKGLVAVDPNDVKTNLLWPAVVIEEVWVDGRRMAEDKTGASPLRIPPGHNRFEFQYTGLSFVAPEKVCFKYRLEGLETEWVDAGTRRNASYSHIPPGDYTFRVIACNNDEVWNETGAALAFTVLPQFWQTLWFRGLAGLTLMAAVAAGVRFDTRRRMRRKLERLERQQALERERARIAKDIHDDLGASLTRITLLSQSARSELDDLPQAAADLDRIYSTARDLTRAMDEIVWAVNPQHDTLDSLASYLGRTAQDFLGTAGIRCRLDMPVHLPAWPLTAEVRHNLFLAFKEALHNVIKHAAASEVRISLSLQPAAFALAVEDNGRGFAPETPGGEVASDPARLASGNGLANMRRRLAEIGGRCEIQSARGKGTKVTFIVAVKTTEA